MKMGEIVIDLDFGLVGTFVKYVDHKSESGYKYYVYCPFNSFPAREVTSQKPVHKDNIYEMVPFVNLKGISPRIIVIYRGGPESLFGNKFSSDESQLMKELKEKVKSLEMKNASLSQELENARSGVNKAISSMKSVNKPQQSSSSSIFDRIGGSQYRSGSVFDNEDD